MKDAQSIINNFKLIKGNRFGASEATACLEKAMAATGKCRRVTLVQMILYAFENNPEYKEAQVFVNAPKTDDERAKRCLTVLRRLRGQSEQSLITSMIRFAYTTNPDYKVTKSKK